MARRAQPTTLHINGPVTLDFGKGIRILLSPAGRDAARAPRGDVPADKSTGRPGRKPSPATLQLVAAMQEDAAKGNPRTRSEYLDVLREAGYTGSAASGGAIVAREAKRILGGLRRRGARGPSTGAGKRGRQPSRATQLLRERLASDRAGNGLKDAAAYVKWLVDQPGVKMGLKQARPIVYRELRAAR
jgi:hypothetical protein